MAEVVGCYQTLICSEAVSTDPRIPPLLQRLVDDAAVFPPGNAPLPDALRAHVRHRAAWYADLIGPLLLPASALAGLTAPLPRIGVVGDTGLAAVGDVFAAAAAATPPWAQLEIAVAKRGEDPQPGLRTLLAEAGVGPPLTIYAELPLTWGLLGALDTLAREREAGARVAPKFRTGGLAAELFPTPVELAAVICACRDRNLPYKLTAGLHRGVRYTDPETGFTHHGFLNVLAADLLAADGVEVADVAEVLAATDPRPVLAVVEAALGQERPLWIGYGSCSVDEPVTELVSYSLIEEGPA